eukprot:6715550-Prymnesium_polylepis.1
MGRLTHHNTPGPVGRPRPSDRTETCPQTCSDFLDDAATAASCGAAATAATLFTTPAASIRGGRPRPCRLRVVPRRGRGLP